MKRYVIYFLYAPDGQVSDACLRMLRAMRAQADGMCLVSNGPLNEAAKARLVPLRAALMERFNNGYDVGAYREALVSLGPNALAGYDELVLMNYTLAGPVRPLGEMFTAMDARTELDFWGVTRHYAMASRRFGAHAGRVPEHIQSHFIAVRARLFQSEAFWTYWRAMRLPKSYEQAVALHEARFTPYFTARGFRWDTYVDTEELRGIFVNPIMSCPRWLIETKNCPVFKRRSFFTPYQDELRRTAGEAGAVLYEYLKQKTDYPVDTLLRELLPQNSLAEMARDLGWHALLPADGGNAAAQPVRWPACEALPGGEIVLLTWTEKAPGAQGWYSRRAAEWFLASWSQVISLFENDPLLGVVSPAAPLYEPLFTARAALWQKQLPQLKALAQKYGLTVPLTGEPLPVPFGGVAAVRRTALGGTFLPFTPLAPWILPLVCQQNGYSCCTAAPLAGGGAARARQETALYAAQRAPEAAKQLGRAVKRQLKGRR